MYYLYLVVPLIQITTAVHAIKTGRSWSWLRLILFFPVLGSTIYVIVEVLLGLPRYNLGSLGNRLLNVLQPDRELAILQERLEISDTVQNRKSLADYYLRVHQPESAIKLYKSCLHGAFQNDPEITLDLCAALFSAQLYKEAKAPLEELRIRSASFEPSRRELLYARTLEQLGQESEAINIYENLVAKYGGGEEARCRWALLLEKVGHEEKAKSVYEDILKKAKRSHHHYRRSQREWINLAREGVERLSAA